MVFLFLFFYFILLQCYLLIIIWFYYYNVINFINTNVINFINLLDFKMYKNEKDHEKIKSLLQSGRSQLRTLQNTVNLAIKE